MSQPVTQPAHSFQPLFICLASWLGLAFSQGLHADWPAKQFQVQTREPVQLEKADIQEEVEYGTGIIDSLWESVAGSEGSEWQGAAGQAEQWMDEIGGLYRNGGHEAPYIQPIVQDNGVPKYRVYIFPFTGSRYRGGYAYAGGGYQLSDCAGSSQINWISYNADFMPRGAALPKKKYVTFAHEMFHALQYGDQLMADCFSGNRWIGEGMADGASYYLINKKWSNYNGRINGSSSATGLRHYDWPLNFSTGRRHVGAKSLENKTSYLTSSFWRFFPENFGGVKVLPHFLDVPLPKNANGAQLIEWLDERLRTEPDIQSGLYLAYPHFVSEFASYGGSRYTNFASRSFGTGEGARTAWLKEAFSSCREITLTPDDAVQKIPISIMKIAAICIRVKYEGFSGNVTSQMEVINKRLDKVDQLHLGWAWEFGPDGEKNCYQEHKSRKTLWPPCIRKAFSQTGPTEGTYARTWAEETIDFGTSSGQAEKIYILSNVAEEPWKTKDISGFEFKAGVTNSSLNGEPAEPTHNMPVQRKSGASKPMGKVGKEELYGLKTDPPIRQDSLTSVGLHRYAPHRDKGGKPQTSGGFSVTINDLKYGQTGAVKGAVVLQALDPRNKAGPVSSLFCKDGAKKVIGEVTQSDELAFRISVDANVCQMGPATIAQCEQSGCPVVEHVSGKVNVTFGWRQFNSTAPVDIRTNGVEAYINTMPDSLEEAMKFGAGTAITDTTGDPGDAGNGPGDSSGSGGMQESCSCTCDELAATDSAAEDYKARIAAGEQASMGKISQFSRCAASCQREYMICRMEQGNREKQAEERAREQARESAKPCDCSCEALADFDARTKDMQTQVAAGGTVSNEALQGLRRLVQCAQECQSQHLACRMQGSQ
ncbi:MAG: hypothetical protein WBS20_13450 [Lysobacterales bacterium]